MFHFSVEKKEVITFWKKVSVLVFRLAWKFQKTKPKIEKNVTCENLKPEVLVSSAIISKILPNTYVGLYVRKNICR